MVNKNAGSVSLSGAVSGSNQGVVLTGNTGAVINFSGGISLSTGANAAFTATGGGTVSATQNNTTIVNTLTTTTGTALNVTNTTISAAFGLTFRSITSNGSGAANGIILDGAGTGGLTVTGNGGTCTSAATCTGGTISNKTGADGTGNGIGIYVNNTSNVSITRMKLNDFTNYAVRGTNVTSFAMNNSFIDGVNGNNAGADEGTIIFDGLLGTSSFSADTIKGGFEDNFRIRNSSGTANITIDSCTIRDTSTGVSGNDNLIIEPSGTATVTAHVTNNTFAATNGDHFQTSTTNSATLNIVFTGNFYSGGGGASALGQGITISGGNIGSSEHVNFNVSNNGTSGNPLVGNIQGGAININEGQGAGTWQGQVSNNWIGNTAVANSGSAQSSGIRVENHSTSGTLTAIIGGPNASDGNHVRQWNNGPGINTQAGDAGNATNTGALNITVRNNVVSNPGANAQHGLVVNAGAGAGNNQAQNQVCADVLANTLDGNAVNGGSGIRLRQRELSTVKLPGYGGTQFDTTAVQNFEIAQNPGNTSAVATSSLGGGYQNTAGGGSCAQPTVPTAPTILKPADVTPLLQQDSEALSTKAIEQRMDSDRADANSGVVKGPSASPAQENQGSSQEASRLMYVRHHQMNQSRFVQAVLPISNRNFAFASFRPSSMLDQRAVPASYLVAASQKNSPTVPQTTVTQTIGALPAGKSVTIKFSVTVNNPPAAAQVSTQGTVSATGISNVLTDDPDTGTAGDPTVTLIDLTITWAGGTSTNWDTGTNWNTTLAPVAINDVSIPAAGVTNEPTISASSPTINSLTIATGRTLTITGQTLNIAGNWTNNGALAGNGTVVFNGNNNTETLAGSSTFNNLTINHTGTGNVTATGSTLAVSNLLRIQAGTFISSSTFKDVQIDSGATLQQTAATTMNVSGNWTNNGSFTASTGTVNFNGGAAQTIGGSSPTTFNILTDANTAAPLAVNTNANAGGALTVNANAVLAPAAAVIIGGGGTLTGNGTAQVTRTAATADFSSQYTITNKTLTNLTVEYIGGAAQTGSALTYGNLKINNSSGVTLGGNATVNGVLTLTSGDLNTTASFTLTMPVAATSAGTTDVVGNVKRTGFVTNGAALSFGNPFNSIKINTGTTTAPTDINVNLDKAVPTTPAPFAGAIARKYTITPTGGSGISATLRLHYLDSELNGNTEGATLNLFRYDGANWHKEGQSSNDTANNWVEKNNVTQFSPWTMNSTVPTEARLESFNATGYDGGTLVEWRTGFEVDNLGFNLYRDEGGKRVAVNSQLVAGSALVAGSGVAMRAGQSYAWWDGAASKSAAQYWLESVDLNGQSAWHGPFFSKFVGGGVPARGNSSMLGSGESAQAGLTLPVERAALPRAGAPGQIALQSGLAGQAAVKMWVKREGFYRVTASELAQAGLDPRADTRLLQVYADGQQIPINVISDKDGLLSAIEFYGRGLDAAFTDQRVYWLISGSQPGLRIQQVKGAGQPTASQSFPYTAERRDRTIYFSALRNGDRENFFGPVIAASPRDQSLTLQHVDQSASGTATIEIALQGVTTLQHKVWVYLNGTFAGEVSFDGQTGEVSRLNVAQSLLRSGENQVRLVTQGGSGDISLVDYIRLSYWHSFAADDNALRLTTSGNQEVTIGGFTSGAIRVLDVTDPDAVQELGAKIEQQKSGFAVTVASPGAGETRLLATTDDQPGKPAKIAANQPSGWRTPVHGADLVMIAPREFFSAIEPLRALRSKQGLKVALADIEDVFDEFSFGNKSPQAVKDFLLYATTNWKIKPGFVLLVGDASYDAKNYLGLGDSDLVPTRLIDTSLMETASDDWLADFNSDGIADLAVGRLAARTPAEASTMVRKIIGYENSEPLGSMLLVADINNGFDFESASTQLRALIPANLRVEQINRGQVDDATAKSRLIDAITRGQKVVNYMGHGSVNLWSGSLLTNEDAGTLTNGERLPVFVMMTCLNGYFHDPSLDSLAESLLKAENGGAVAVWTSTGMTVPVEQLVLNQQLYQLLFTTGNAMTLGEATARAKAAVTDGDIRRTWVLLGDPTMRLK